MRYVKKQSRRNSDTLCSVKNGITFVVSVSVSVQANMPPPGILMSPYLPFLKKKKDLIKNKQGGQNTPIRTNHNL